jgi:hypothetical protein
MPQRREQAWDAVGERISSHRRGRRPNDARGGLLWPASLHMRAWMSPSLSCPVLGIENRSLPAQPGGTSRAGSLSRQSAAKSDLCFSSAHRLLLEKTFLSSFRFSFLSSSSFISPRWPSFARLSLIADRRRLTSTRRASALDPRLLPFLPPRPLPSFPPHKHAMTAILRSPRVPPSPAAAGVLGGNADCPNGASRLVCFRPCTVCVPGNLTPFDPIPQSRSPRRGLLPTRLRHALHHKLLHVR